MFIQTEATPNPATLKFIPGVTVMAAGTADFRTVDEAGPSPLAQRLFALDGVQSVFLGSDFVTVTKGADADWQSLRPAVLGAVMEHFTQGLPVFTGGGAAGAQDDDPIVVQIKELLETRVRPAVAADGGDIIFDRFDAGVVYLRMQGSCSGCPSSTATLKHGIENLLKHFVPEVREVQPA